MNSSVSEDFPMAQDDIKTMLAEELSKIRVAEPQEKLEVKEEPVTRSMRHALRQHGGADEMLTVQHSIKSAELQMPQKKGKLGASDCFLEYNSINSCRDNFYIAEFCFYIHI